MNKPKLYLDVCTLCRPFDDQHRMRIRLETDCYFLIMQAIQEETYELLYSKVHEKEIAAINNMLERTEIIETIYQNGKQCSGDFQVLRKRADDLVNAGLGIADAAHVAFAEVNADYLISCDDRLIKRSKREKVNVMLMTPPRVLCAGEFSMIEHIVMNEEQLIKKAVQVLVREFGSVEASRFLSIPQHKREDSLKHHYTWQNGLDKQTFFDEVFSD